MLLEKVKSIDIKKRLHKAEVSLTVADFLHKTSVCVNKLNNLF